VSYNFRKQISEKINKLPLKYFDKMTHGEVLSRITNDVDTVSHTLNQSLSQIITSATTLIGVLIMMISISWQMTLVALLIFPISMVLTITIIKKFIFAKNCLSNLFRSDMLRLAIIDKGVQLWKRGLPTSG